MTRVEFQKAHGPTWAEVTKNPAFFAAMQLAGADKLQRMAGLSDEEIQRNGTAILADFRGHLQYENFLIELAVAPEEPFLDLPPETYADPSIVVSLPPPPEPERKARRKKP